MLVYGWESGVGDLGVWMIRGFAFLILGLVVGGCERGSVSVAGSGSGLAPSGGASVAGSSSAVAPSGGASVAGSSSAVASSGGAGEGRGGWRLVDVGSFERRRSGCSLVGEDLRLFAYQAVTGECVWDPQAGVRRLGRVEVGAVEGAGDRRVVVVTTWSLEDDSVRDERRRFEVARVAVDGGSAWRIVWAGAVYRCWPGRGQQEFAKDLCI